MSKFITNNLFCLFVQEFTVFYVLILKSTGFDS